MNIYRNSFTFVLAVLLASFPASASDLIAGPSNSTLTVNAGDTYTNVVGGNSTTADTSNNTITMNGGTVTDTIFGGYTGKNANNNTVNMKGGTVGSDVWVSYVTGGNGTADGNEFTMTGGKVNGVVYVGRGVSSGSSNTVVIEGGNIDPGEDMLGVYAGYGDRSDSNQITIRGNADIDGYVYGSFSTGSGGAKDNSVVISGGDISGNVYAGVSEVGNMDNNSILISGGHIGGNIAVSYAKHADATCFGNKIEITNGTIDGVVQTGYNNHVYHEGGDSQIHDSNGEILISGGIIGGYVSSGSNSNIEISGGTIGSYVLAGHNSTVTIDGGKMGGGDQGDTWGTGVRVMGNSTLTMNAGEVDYLIAGNKNSTIIYNGGTVGEGIQLTSQYGGVEGSHHLIINGDLTTKEIWSHKDKITIDGCRVVTGRLSNFGDYEFIVPGDLTASESVVTITGNEKTNMTGATVSAFEDPGHLLDDRNVVILIDKATGSFQETIFNGVVELIPVSVLVRDEQLIATYELQSGEPGEKGEPGDKGETGDKGPDGDKGETGDKGPDGDKGETGEKGPDGDKGETGDKGPDGDKGETGEKGPDGDKGETGDKGPDGDKGETGNKGPDGDKGETGDKGPDGDKGEQGEQGEKGPPGDPGECTGCGGLTESELQKIVERQTETLSYAILDQVSIINNAADMAVNSGIQRAMEAIGRCGVGNLTAFFSFNASNSKYDGNFSSIDIDSTSALAGVAYSPRSADALVVGLFGEFGRGNTDGYNGDLRTDSKNRYAGGGIMTRWTDVCGSGLYLEATARMGKSKLDFYADGFLANLSGETKSVSYEMKGNYYSAHFGIGKFIPVTQTISLDASIKYLWTQQKGNTFEASGEKLRLSSVNSHRIRTGGRIHYAYNKTVSLYGGAWFEREFSGKPTIQNINSGKRYRGGKLTGTTTIGEVGISISDKSKKRWNVDLGITSASGKRDGIGGNATFAILF